MANLYEVFQPAIQAPFEQGPYGLAWGNAFGEVKDQLMNEMMLSVMARFPTLAPLDAIGAIAAERGLFQGQFGTPETTAHFIARLLNAWGAWTIGGTYWGLLAQLNGAGYNQTGTGNGSSAYIIAANGYIYGPGDTVTVPDPIHGIAGTPPSSTSLNDYFTNGGASTSNEWIGSHAYALNSLVTPTTQPGTWFIAIVPGTTSGTQPNWASFAFAGGQATDGGVTWLYGGNYTAEPVQTPWTFGNNDGQGNPWGVPGTTYPWTPWYWGTPPNQAPITLVPPGQTLGGTADPSGQFWSTFAVMLNPLPTSWSSIANPPTNSSAPTSGEIAFLQSIINKFKPAKTTCAGIVAIASGLPRACWGWPLTTATNLPQSHFISRAVTGGTVPILAVNVTRPASCYSWLPNTPVASAGGSTYMLMTPSAAYMAAHTGATQFLFTSPASSGTTGFTEPVWPTTLTNTVTDGGITWTCSASLSNWKTGVGVTVFSV
jgi:hypothetical protein